MKMKKIVVVLSALALALGAQAASVDWQYTGVSEQTGYTVYVFTDAVAAQYDTFADFTKASVANAKIVETGGRTKTYWTSQQTYVEGAPIGENLYFAVIKDADATEYTYGSMSTVGKIYDPAAQQTSPGIIKAANANVMTPGKIGGVTPPGPSDVPEPTSGLLLVLGGAALALRRRR